MDSCTLLILDGFGDSKSQYGNAISEQGTPNIDKIKKEYPHTIISASGEDVGKLKGQMGDSEVGHMNIGSGRVVVQNVLRINRAIEDGSFFTNKNILKVINVVNKNKSKLHLMGLLSDGGVHSMYQHLFAFIKMAKQNNVQRVYIHIITDGRDTGINDGKKYIKILQKYIRDIGVGKIATVCGRFYAMDREQNYDRTQKYYDCVVFGNAEKSSDPIKCVQKCYDEGLTDEYITPFIIDEEGLIEDKDGLIIFNYRKDRPRQILNAFKQENFDKFKIKNFKNLTVLTPMQISESYKNILVAFDTVSLKQNLSEVVSQLGLRQLKVAESTKYPHVTYYLNGTIEQPYPLEDRKLFESDKIANFADAPKMQAYKITDYTTDAILSKKYSLIVVNIANGDMVGHTGNFKASKVAVKVIDDCVNKIKEATIKAGSNLLIIADHGNIEKMLNKDGSVNTAHSTNKVPCILVGNKYKNAKLLSGGRLCDVAPTILDIMGIKKPQVMTGKSLIKEE